MSSDNLSQSLSERDAFARLLIDRLRLAGETAEIRYDPEDFTLRVEGGELAKQAILGNLFAEYQRAEPAKQQLLVRNYVRSWFCKGMPEDFEDVHPDLLPTVRTRSYVELGQLNFRLQQDETPAWPHLPLAEHLSVSLVYDLPEALRQIQQYDLDQWGVDFATALARAISNLREISHQPFMPAGVGVWRSPWRDNLDASRLVLPELFLAHPLKGNPVAMIPNRDTLLFTGSRDDSGLARLLELAEATFEQPRAVSGLAVQLTPEGWIPFLPPLEHSLYRRFRLLFLRSLGSDYNNQKELLEQFHTQHDLDIHVAAYSLVLEKQTGDPLSYCVWAMGIDTLLPVVDRVCFFQPGDDEDGRGGHILGWADWAVLEESLETILEPTDWYPIRYRTREFPDESFLKALRPLP